MARPTIYTEDLGVEIAWRSAEGKSLKTICTGRGMPSVRTVFRWRRDHPEFAALLDLAVLDRAQLYVEQTIDIADEQAADSAQVSRAKNRIQARQWAAARLNPAKFSERLVASHITPAEEARPFAPESPDLGIDLARRIAFVLAKGVQLRRERNAKDQEARTDASAQAATVAG
ncbi:hypothetical protein [uncultured Piscinibacter sp.]|uniref:terminase small subunit-like protein n=1 Tax=uncultured Piscinibacter sp. TaxID=1131835 RepID=UPI00345B5ABD